MQAIAARCDFLGVNYYFPEVVSDAPGAGPFAAKVMEQEEGEHTAFGWPVSPEGMVTLLTRIQRDYAPAQVYLTENGSTYEDVVEADGSINDLQRLSYLARHLDAARQALAQGVPLKGYFAWSLLDNFEWADGYATRFGLVHVDYATQKRTPKLSASFYRETIARNAVA